MEFSINDLVIRLSQAIRRKETHRDYEYVNELATLYLKLITGENMESLMQQFTPRESEDLFKQRCRITQHITKTISQNIMDIFFKIPRSNSVQRNISYTDSNTDKLKELNGILNEFWGDESLDDFMNSRWFELNFTDPNSFVVVEWEKFDNTQERLTPYPLEVNSRQAVMFEYKNNDLEFLIVKTEEPYWVFNDITGSDEEKSKEAYTIYGKNQTVKFTQVTDGNAIRGIMRAASPIKSPYNEARIFQYNDNGDIVGGYYVSDVIQEKMYAIEIYTPHNLGYVPATRIGVRRDLYTKGRTFVSPLDRAIPILMKIVKANSEFDLTMALHTFPQKIQYAPRCKAKDCHGGERPDGSVCPDCHGSGFETITSSQEVITISLPKNKEDMVDLTNMILYVQQPIETVQFQHDYIKYATAYAKEAIFNTELFSKSEISETATGKNISLQNLYDGLYPIAKVYSKKWWFLVTTIADLTELNENLVAFYNFSKDFKLKSLTDLYMDLKMVGDARASEFVKDEIHTDIAKVIYSEDERALQKYNVKRAFYPFSGKTTEEIKLIISTPGMTTEDAKVFYSNYGIIFDDIEMEQAKLGVDFYYLAKDKQKELLDKKIEEIMGYIESEKPEEPDINASLNMDVPPTVDNKEQEAE